MKRKLVLTILLIASFSLTSCSNNTPNSTTKINDSTTQAASTELIGDISYSDIDSIPSGNELLDLTNSFLEQLEIPSVSGFIDYDLSDDGTSQIIDAIIQINDASKLNISAMRITFPDEGEWIIMSISEYDSDPIKYYYGIESIIDHIDIYNFNTGEIISSKESDINTDEIMSEYQEESDKIMEDFNNALDEIAEEYGLDTSNP